MENCRNQQCHNTKGQECRTQTGGSTIETLFRELQPACQHTQPEDQENVTDDGAGDRCLDDSMQAPAQSQRCNNELCCISESRVEEAANASAHFLSEMFRRFAHDTRQR